MKVFLSSVVFLFCCTNSSKATSTLEASGFTNIEITGWSHGCSDTDDTCTGFVATGPTGKRVKGAVGCGRDFGGCGKGCTLRITN